jgi:hypothetical protein
MSTLQRTYTTVPGQLYALISIVGPEGCNQKSEKFGLKILGAFGTRDEAANHAKKLQEEDATFDILLVDMYQWALIPPELSEVEDVHYNEKRLEEIMAGYRENQKAAAKMFEERKRGMLDNVNHFTPGDENSKFYNKPDEAPISHPADVIERLKKEKPDTPMEELVKMADEIVAQEIEERKKARETKTEPEAEAEAEVKEAEN